MIAGEAEEQRHYKHDGRSYERHYVTCLPHGGDDTSGPLAAVPCPSQRERQRHCTWCSTVVVVVVVVVE